MKLNEIAKSIKYSIIIIWNASRKHFILKVCLNSAGVLLTFIILNVWKNIINYTNDGTPVLKSIIPLLLVYCAFLLLEKIIESATDIIQYKYNDEVDYYLDDMMINKTTDISVSFLETSSLIDYQKRAWRLSSSTKSLITIVFSMMSSLLSWIIASILIVQFDWRLAIISAVLCLPSLIGEQNISNIEYKTNKDNATKERAKDYYKEVFWGDSFYEIKLFNLFDFFWKKYYEEWKKINTSLHKRDNAVLLWNITGLLSFLLLDGIVYIGTIIRYMNGTLQIGEIVLVISLVENIRNSLGTLNYYRVRLARRSDEIMIVRSFLELQPETEKSGRKKIQNIDQISFENVSFQYPNSQKKVLRNCSFHLSYGKTTALVGLNGSGKSTIVNLLCRFYNPNDGTIKINEVDIREYDLKDLRSKITVLFQKVNKYSLSLRESIALSDIQRIDDDSKIWDACEQSKAIDFARLYEQGLETNMTKKFDPDGKKLSGGQWQRIALARAFFRKDALFVILDEPSASLDPIAEYEIFGKFCEIKSEKGALIISHRLSSIAMADTILLLKDGLITEEGTHRDLLLQNGEYARLFHLQAEKYSLEH